MNKFIAPLFLVFVACYVPSEELSFYYPDVDPVDDSLVMYPVMTRANLQGPYIYTDGNIDCVMNGNWLVLTVDHLNTDTPLIKIRDPDMTCEPVEYWVNNAMIIECHQRVESWLFSWWDRFYINLYDNGRGTWTGWFHWVVDMGPGYWCFHEFQITEAYIEYRLP